MRFMIYYHRERSPDVVHITIEEADDGESARAKFIERDAAESGTLMGTVTIVKHEQLA